MVPGILVKCLTKMTKIKIQSFFTTSKGIIYIYTLKYITVSEHGIT